MTFDQTEYNVRCEWGEQGVALLAPVSDVVIVIDVLSFSTAVEISTNQGAVVFPYAWKDETAYEFARRAFCVMLPEEANYFAVIEKQP